MATGFSLVTFLEKSAGRFMFQKEKSAQKDHENQNDYK